MAFLLVPAEGRDFPYDEICEWLQAQPDMDFDPKDFTKLILLLERLDAPQVVIDEQQRLGASGKCYDFCQSTEPELMGSLYPDHIRFESINADHAARCRPAIDGAAGSLGLDLQIE